jgi:hypothetical protein
VSQAVDELCNPAEHHYFVADVVYATQEGTVHVLLACTRCGDFLDHVSVVSPKGSEVKFKSAENQR